MAEALGIPTSRLFATSGKAADTRPGQAAGLIRGHCEARQLGAAEVAAKLGISSEEYAEIESGSSEIKEWEPFFLRPTEVLENGFPVFNLSHRLPLLGVGSVKIRAFN